jgi:cation:H+ antiporter
MNISIVYILAGVVLLYAGAEGLVRGSASLAARIGLTPLVIGLTVVAFGTSMPELVVSVGATLAGNGAIAAGNVVGSNIGNIALILGLSALVSPPVVNARVVRVDLPILVAVSLALVWMLGDGRVERTEGALLVVALIAYLAFSLRVARTEPPEIQTEFAEGMPRGPRSPLLDVVFVVVGLGLLVLGARLLVDGAVTIAQGFGVSDAVIGLTVVAIGTSLVHRAEVQVPLRERDLDPRLAEAAVDLRQHRALRRQPRRDLAHPDPQLEVQRAVAEAGEERHRRRLLHHRGCAGAASMRISQHLLHVAAVRHPHRDRQARHRVGERPVGHLLARPGRRWGRSAPTGRR